MNGILALVWKDLKLFFSDRRAMLITLAVPIGIASFMGYITSSGNGPKVTKKIPILVVDQDGSELTKKILADLEEDSLAEPKTVTLEAAQTAVKKGDTGVAVVFPKGFSKAATQAMFRGDPPVVRVIYDPSKRLELQAIQGSIMQVAMQNISQAAFSPGANNVNFREQLADIEHSDSLTKDQKANFRDLFGSLERMQGDPQLKQQGVSGGMQQPFELKAEPMTASKKGDDWSGMAHMFAGMAVQGVMFFGIDAAMGLLRDRRLGIWRRLRASPVNLGQILAGKTLGSAIIAFFVLATILLFGIVVFGIRVEGSWLGLLAVLGAASLMTAAFGLFVASLGKTEQQARGLSTLAVLTMSMLGGAWFPAFLLPGWVQTVSMLVPVRWAVDGFDAMLWRGQGLAGALPMVAALVVFTAVFGAIAMARFSRLPEAA